jgi:hypothetical protein
VGEKGGGNSLGTADWLAGKRKTGEEKFGVIIYLYLPKKNLLYNSLLI